MRSALYNLAQSESRETPKDLSFTRLVAEIHLSAKLFVAQERASDDEDEDDAVDVRKFESDLRRHQALNRWLQNMNWFWAAQCFCSSSFFFFATGAFHTTAPKLSGDRSPLHLHLAAGRFDFVLAFAAKIVSFFSRKSSSDDPKSREELEKYVVDVCESCLSFCYVVLGFFCFFAMHCSLLTRFARSVILLSHALLSSYYFPISVLHAI